MNWRPDPVRGWLQWAAAVAALVLLISLGIIWHRLSDDFERNRRDRFALDTQQVAIRLGERMAAYNQVLRGAAGLFAASGEVTQEDWRRYFAALKLQGDFGGIQGLGFSQWRAEGSRIVYLEPLDERNRRAIGFDMFGEPVRRAAMESARDSGGVAYSGRVRLVQEADSDIQHGILAYHPIYAGSTRPATADARRAALRGWVYSPFRMGRLMDSVVSAHNRALIRIEVFDGDEAVPESLLHDSGADAGEVPVLVATERIVLEGGRRWTLRYSARPGYDATTTHIPLWIETLALGCIALLILGIAWLWISTRRRARAMALRLTAELKVSREQLQHVLDATGEGLWDWDIAAGRVSHNAQWCRLLDLDEREWLDHSFDQFVERIHPDDRDAVQKFIRAELAGAAGYVSEHRMRRRDGSYIWVLDRGRVVMRDTTDAPLRMVGSFAEISARKAAEKALVELNQRLEGLLAAATDFSIVAMDEYGTIVSFNAGAERMLGYAADEVVGKATPMLFHDGAEIVERSRKLSDRLGVVIEGMEAVTAIPLREGREQHEWTYIRKDGSRLLVSLVVTPICAVAGGFLGIAHDITDSRRAEEVLEEINREILDLYDNAPCGYCSLAADGTVVKINRTGLALLGHDAHDLLGRLRLEELLTPSAADVYRRYRSQLLELGAVDGVELEVRRKDGTTMFALLSATALRDSTGEIGSMRVTFSDVSGRRRAEERLIQAEKMEVIGQLTGGLAHDFNNLLGIVLGGLDLLGQRLGGDDPSRRHVELARRAARRAADVTRSLLAVARKQALEPRNLDVDATIADLLPLISQSVGKNIEVGISTCADCRGTRVRVDPAGLSNAILNLSINARDSMPNGGRITIETGVRRMGVDRPDDNLSLPPGNYVAIAVSDIGSGMPPEVAARAFDPFFTTKERGQGTGLGLAMVQGFARQTGGAASIYSEPGKGTTVRLYLPVVMDGTEEVAVKAADPAPPAGRGEGILLVDDEQDLLEVARSWLDTLGYRVGTASSPDAALRLLESESFDLLVSDVVMPGGMDGVALARRVATDRPGMRILLTSGFSGDLVPAGWPLLEKPYSRYELATQVRRQLDS